MKSVSELKEKYLTISSESARGQARKYKLFKTNAFCLDFLALKTGKSRLPPVSTASKSYALNQRYFIISWGILNHSVALTPFEGAGRINKLEILLIEEARTLI